MCNTAAVSKIVSKNTENWYFIETTLVLISVGVDISISRTPQNTFDILLCNQVELFKYL